MDYEIVTYATHNQGLYNDLISNKYHKTITVLGFGTKWINYRESKIRSMYNYLLKTREFNRIVIFLDGFDSVVNKNPDLAIKEFKKLNCKILLSVNTKDTLSSTIFFDRVYPNSCSKPVKGKYIINTGMYMGYTEDLIKMYEVMLNNYHDVVEDQRLMNLCCKFLEDRIKLDKNENVFQNVDWNNRQNVVTTGVFIQYPGSGAGNLWSRLKRVPGDYGAFFINEIILLLSLIIIGIICILQKLHSV